MRKIPVLLILVCLPYFGYTQWIKGSEATVAYDSERIVITQGDNTFYATEESNYTAELRVYGIQNGFGSGGGWNPMGHATHLFMALPVAQMDPPEACESRAVAKATFLNFNVPEDALKDRIAAIEQIEGRRCVWVTGKKMHIDEFFYKDEDHSSSLTRQGKMDPRYLIVLNDIEVISCD